MSGIGLWPPASTFASSPKRARTENASSSVVGAKYSKLGGYMTSPPLRLGTPTNGRRVFLEYKPRLEYGLPRHAGRRWRRCVRQPHQAVGGVDGDHISGPGRGQGAGGAEDCGDAGLT